MSMYEQFRDEADIGYWTVNGHDYYCWLPASANPMFKAERGMLMRFAFAEGRSIECEVSSGDWLTESIPSESAAYHIGVHSGFNLRVLSNAESRIDPESELKSINARMDSIEATVESIKKEALKFKMDLMCQFGDVKRSVRPFQDYQAYINSLELFRANLREQDKLRAQDKMVKDDE